MGKLSFFYIFLFTLGSFDCWGIDTAKILEVSSSGRSIILDRGFLEGIKMGMEGRFLLPEGDIDKPYYKYIAYGEVIKVHSNYSYWHLTDINRKIFLDKGLKTVFVTMGRVNRGRQKLDSLRRRIILRKGDTPLKYMESKKLSVPHSMIKKRDQYVMGKELTRTYSPLKEDNELYEFDVWSYDKGLQYVDEYMQEVETARPSDQGKIASLEKYKEYKKHRDLYDQKLFESVVKSSIKKFNDFEYNLDTFYKDQRKDENAKEIRKEMSSESIYKKYQENKKKLRWVSQRALSQIKNGGKLWSASMDDDQLRRFFVESGIRKENERQRLALGTYDANELQIFYSFALKGHYADGAEGFQGSNYSLGIGYEFYLRRTLPSLAKWSLDGSFERTIAFYNAGSVNGRFTEGLLKLGVNYYFYNLPSSIYRWIWNVGVGFKGGNSLMQSLTLSKEYNYRVFGVPLYINAKYRFLSGDEKDQSASVGWGLNFKMSNEYLRMSVVDRIDDDISESLLVNDIRFTVGLSTYF